MPMPVHNDSHPRQRAHFRATSAPFGAIYRLCFDISTNRGARIPFVLKNLQKNRGYPLTHIHLSQGHVQSSQSRALLTPLFPLDTKIGGRGGHLLRRLSRASMRSPSTFLEACVLALRPTRRATPGEKRREEEQPG